VRGGFASHTAWANQSGQCLGTEYATSGFVDCSAASAAGGHPSLVGEFIGLFKDTSSFAVWLVGVDRDCSFDLAQPSSGRYAEVYSLA